MFFNQSSLKSISKLSLNETIAKMAQGICAKPEISFDYKMPVCSRRYFK